MKINRTDPDNKDFRELTLLLDELLKENDGDEHIFYKQFNNPESISNVIVVYKNYTAAGCGAFRKYSEDTAEIKRMFVKDEFRGSGIGKKILSELENWSRELDFSECILETGKKHIEAIHMYRKCGYELIPNYGQYINMENSICMKKRLT